jgi:murein DD-endopeptidase MepM/ murein hydrolase activator NlpD
MAISPPVDPSLARLTSPWGWRKLRGEDDYHSGIDLAAAEGTPALAVADGRVRLVDWVSGYGQTVVLEHAGPTWSLYGHLMPSSATVAVGELVRAGQPIARIGKSGGTKAAPRDVSSPHLHFELLSQWPPAGIDQDRFDPTATIWAPFSSQRPRPRPPAPEIDSTVAAGSFLLVLAGLWFVRRRVRHKKTPRVHNPPRRSRRLLTQPYVD